MKYLKDSKLCKWKRGIFNLLAQYILVVLRKIKLFFQVEELCNNIYVLNNLTGQTISKQTKIV